MKITRISCFILTALLLMLLVACNNGIGIVTAAPTETGMATATATEEVKTPTPVLVPSLGPLPSTSDLQLPFPGYKQENFVNGWNKLKDSWNPLWKKWKLMEADQLGSGGSLVARPVEGEAGVVCEDAVDGSYAGMTLCPPLDLVNDGFLPFPGMDSAPNPDYYPLFIKRSSQFARLKSVGTDTGLVLQEVDGQGKATRIIKTKNDAEGNGGVWVAREYVPTPMEILQSNLGNYTLVSSPDGSYQQIKTQEGTVISEVKVFNDGVVNLAYKFAGSTKDLYIAPQAISSKDNKLTVGLWDYENGAWSQTRSLTAAEVATGVEDNHKLVVVLGSEREQAMIDTIFMARDLAMARSATYNPADEFKNISVMVNFKTIDNFDPRPAKWSMVNWSLSSAFNGIVVFMPVSSSNEIVYEDNSRLEYAGPKQLGLGPGYFKMEIQNKDGAVQPPIIHLPVIVMDTDGSLKNLSALIRQSDLPKITHLLTRQDRGKLWTWLHTTAHITEYAIDDQELVAFEVKVNRSRFCNVVDCMGANQMTTIYLLPAELSNTFFTVSVKP